MNEYSKGRREHSLEYHYRMNDGSLHWLHVDSIMRSENQASDILAYVFIKDIDHQKKSAMAYESAIDEDTDYVQMLNVITGKACILRIKSGYGYDERSANEYYDFDSFCREKGLKECKFVNDVTPDSIK